MNKLSQYLVESILNEVEEGITVMLPGGFKPPHEGHYQLAKGYADMPQVKEVVILIGPKDRDGITIEDSEKIWKTLLGGAQNIRVERSKYPSPLLSKVRHTLLDQAAKEATTIVFEDLLISTKKVVSTTKMEYQ
jgi:nicotinic acid mononucleotide adenylyltransferase